MITSETNPIRMLIRKILICWVCDPGNQIIAITEQDIPALPLKPVYGEPRQIRICFPASASVSGMKFHALIVPADQFLPGN